MRKLFTDPWDSPETDGKSDPMAPIEAKAERTVFWVGLWIVLGLGVTALAGGKNWSVALLIALAAGAAGGAVGFLFGIPLTSESLPSAAVPKAEEKAANPPVSTPRLGASGLEQVADWLTKIIIGVGLTQLNALRDHLVSLSESVGKAVGPAGADPANKAFGMALLCYFGASGFVFGTLATRLILVRLMLWSKWQVEFMMPQKIQAVESKLPTALRAAEKAFSANLASLEHAAAEARALAPTPAAEAASWEPTSPPLVSDDPQKGRFGGQSESAGRRLEARVTPRPDSGDEIFDVRIALTSTDPNKPLSDPVRFFLHNTFSPDKVVVVPKQGRAELSLCAWGAFTVGAIADGGQTKLELDLAKLPDAPAKFRER